MQVPNDSDPNWNLDKITIQDDKAGSELASFDYGDWLDTEKTSASIGRWQSLVEYRYVGRRCRRASFGVNGDIRMGISQGKGIYSH